MPEPCCLCTSSQPTQQTDSNTISIHTLMEALDFLLVRNLIPMQQPIMNDNLATALLHISQAQKIPKALEEAIHSISILLTDLTDHKLALDVSTNIHKCLLGTNRTLCPIIEKLEGLATAIKLTSTSLSDIQQGRESQKWQLGPETRSGNHICPPPLPPQAPHMQPIMAPLTYHTQQLWQLVSPPPPNYNLASLKNVTYAPNNFSSTRPLMHWVTT